MDYSRAIDKVNYSKFLAKLTAYGITIGLKSFLSNRTPRTEVGESLGYQPMLGSLVK
jgi:hypothetical protein